MRRATGRAERFLQFVEGPRFLIIAADVAKQLQKLGQGLLIDVTALLLDAIAHALSKMFVRPRGPGNANHGHVQVTTSNHVIKSRKDLFVR